MKWLTVTLGAISRFGPQYGANASGITRTGLRPRYVRITDIDTNGSLLTQGAVEADTDDVADFRLEEGDLLFARSGNTVGKVYRHAAANGDCVFAGYLIRFRLNQEVADARFVFFFTQSAPYRAWVMSKKRVAGQPNVNGTEYAGLRMPLPPIKEQRRIVELLEQADGLRRQRAEADSLADRTLPVLFHKMFGDPATNPRGWPRLNLGEITAITALMIDPRQPEYLDLPHVGPDRIESGTGRLLHCQTAREEALISGKYLFDASHVLYSKIRPYLRKVALPEFSGLCSADMYPVTPLPNLMTREFLWALLLSPAFTNYTTEHSGRANMPKLNREQFAAYKCAVPPIELQRKFNRQVVQLRQLEIKREMARTNIETLFATLLHRAFTGELTAKWREAHLKELLAEMEHQARLLGIKSTESVEQLVNS